MATQVAYSSPIDPVSLLMQSNLAFGDVRKLPMGVAGANADGAVSSGSYGRLRESQAKVNVLKDTTVALLAGGRVYWDYSAGQCTYKKVDDRDFYIGRMAADAALADPNAQVYFNLTAGDELDLERDPYITVPVGTQALGGFLPPQRIGGGLKFLLTATSEAQKVDALSKDGFAAGGAKGIVECAFNLISQGSATAPDFNVGIASGTNATDFDSITAYAAALAVALPNRWAGIAGVSTKHSEVEARPIRITLPAP